MKSLGKRKMVKTRRNKKRGGAEDYEQNVKNCINYWEKDIQLCRTYAGITNYPGIAKKMIGVKPTSRKNGVVPDRYK
jgi:hypothetical protein